jgi:TonB-dependent starch-binding outer membrane protein SusC
MYAQHLNKILKTKTKPSMTKLFKQRIYLRFLIAIFCIFSGVVSMAQVILKGKVTGPNGAGISNVSVQVEPSATGANTDASGTYTITAKLKPGKYNLVFSSVGFKRFAKAITVSGNEVIENDVTLISDPLGLDEVVVTGYGTPTRKKQIVNSISTVSGRDLSNSGAQSIDAAMQGKVAGAQINQNSGNPAGGVSVRLRGPSTVSGSSEPLYIIDGVIVNNDSRALIDLGGGSQNRLVDLNMNDVDRIEVIKGAAASAIYGSRASNGVVQIFTKKGKDGAPQFSFSTSIKSSAIRKKLEYNQVPFRFVNPTNNADLTTVPVTRYDLQDKIFRSAMGTENNLSVSGGSSSTKYFASISNYYNQGIIKASDFNRNGVRMRINQKLNNKASMSVGANYVVSASRDVPNGGLAATYGALPGFIFAPNYINPEKDPTTGIFPNLANGVVQRTNPLEVIERFKFTQRTNRMITDLNFNYRPIAGLAIDITSGFDNYTQSATGYIPPVNTTDLDNSGLSRRADATIFQTNTDLNISYNKAVSSTLQSTTVLGGTMQYEKGISFSASANALGLFGQTINNGIVNASENRYEKSIRGAFLQQTVGINNNLFVNAAIRVDGSSVFSKDYAAQFYPKVGASYIISNEKFWSGISNVVSFLKLRAAWGKSGNLSGIGAFDRLNNYGPNSYGSQVGYVPTITRGNLSVRPETQIELELGFDANFFKDRVTVEFNVFDKKVQDLIIEKPLALTTGFDNTLENVGNLSNKGIEFLVRAIPVKTKNIEWTTSISYLGNKNVVTDIPTTDGKTILGGFGFAAAVNGAQLGAFYGSFFARNPDGSFLLNPAGFPQVEKGTQGVNGEYVIGRNTTTGQPQGANLVKVIGRPIPKHVASFINTFTYKRLTMKMQWDGQYGFDIFNFTNRVGSRATYGGLKLYEPELRGEVPKGTSIAVFSIFENWIEKGDFTKLRELSLAYQLPGKLWKFTNATITVAGRNLLAITPYSGFDPETSAAGQSNGVRSFDFNEVPIPKTFSVTVNLGF